jgi:acyl-CoA thioesterase YciA
MKIETDRKENYTSFVVMPEHANYMYPLIFGGVFMSQLDLAAATLVNKIIKQPKTAAYIDNAVTHKAEFEFIGPSYVGDLIHMHSYLDSVGKKSIVVNIEAFRETRTSDTKIKVAVAKFVFVTRLGDVYTPHNLEM